MLLPRLCLDWSTAAYSKQYPEERAIILQSSKKCIGHRNYERLVNLTLFRGIRDYYHLLPKKK